MKDVIDKLIKKYGTLAMIDKDEFYIMIDNEKQILDANIIKKIIIGYTLKELTIGNKVQMNGNVHTVKTIKKIRYKEMQVNEVELE